MKEVNYPEEFPEELTDDEILELMTEEEIDESRESFRDCTLKNDFLFSQVYQYKEAIKGIVKLLLNIKVNNITRIQSQDVIATGYGLKSIRTDVTVMSDGRAINLEMQAYDDDDLFRRARHHHGVLDCNHLKAGRIPSDLPDTYVIFICTKDPVGEGKPIYMSRNRTKEVVNYEEVGDCLDVDDGAFTLYVNLSAYKDVEYKPLRKFMQFCLEGDIVKGDRYINRLKKIIKQIKIDPGMERKYMTLRIRDSINIRIGEKRGEARGKAEGVAHGKAEKELQMVIDFLSLLDNQALADKTRFTVEEIQKLREEHSPN